MTDEEKKARRMSSGKKYKGWDPDKERATYDAGFYEKHQRYYVRAIPRIAEFIRDSFPEATSIVDIGCGTGEMLAPLQETHSILGVDFSRGASETLVIPRECYLDHDLTTPLPEVDHRDIVMSLEVWEHIPAEFEEQYVQNLLAFSPKHLIVSCAEPGQWGRHHYNTAGVDQVREKMTALGYEVDEGLTAKWQKIKHLAAFYRKNTLVFHEKSVSAG